jgi:hypothetical protein
MRTTLNLPDDLVSALVAETGEKNRTLIIRRSLEETLRRLRRNKLKGLRGRFDLDVDLVTLRKADRE